MTWAGRTSWADPQDDGIWINAKKAFYVIGSTKRGGMGAKETVPFEDRSKAEDVYRSPWGADCGSQKHPSEAT